MGSAEGLHAKSADGVPSDADSHASQCDMAMACTMVASVREGTALTGTLPELRQDIWAPVAQPHSVLGAPEPPPPRA